MKIDMEREFSKEITAKRYPEFLKDLKIMIGSEKRKIVLDFKDVSEVDSQILIDIATISNFILRKGGEKITLLNCNECILDLIRLRSLSGVFTIQ